MTVNLLRPQQVADMQSEQQVLAKSLHNPHIQDKGQVQRQLRRVEQQLASQSPTAFHGPELDRAASRERQLLTELLVGCPSQEEMRKAPAGAVGKHMAWEKQNKQKLQEWKHLRLRLNAGTSDPDVANFERYRPKTSSLNMDHTLIPGQRFYMPETTGQSVVFTDAQLRVLRELSPDIADKLALLSNDQRQDVKDALGLGLAADEDGQVDQTTKVVKAKRAMSPEARQAASDRMRARHAAKKAGTKGG